MTINSVQRFNGFNLFSELRAALCVIVHNAPTFRETLQDECEASMRLVVCAF
jgi:hypothetical protein